MTPSRALLRSSESGDFGLLGEELKRRSFEIAPPPIPAATFDNLNALYNAELAASDASFGKLLDHLKAKGVYEDTLVVFMFMSDHGEEILDRGKLGHMHKVYQELMRIPLVVKSSHGREGGKRITQLCQNIDVMPTILVEAGLPKPVQAAGRMLSAG